VIGRHWRNSSKRSGPSIGGEAGKLYPQGRYREIHKGSDLCNRSGPSGVTIYERCGRPLRGEPLSKAEASIRGPGNRSSGIIHRSFALGDRAMLSCEQGMYHEPGVTKLQRDQRRDRTARRGRVRRRSLPDRERMPTDPIIGTSSEPFRRDIRRRMSSDFWERVAVLKTSKWRREPWRTARSGFRMH
jgi:hypothetical protein